MHLLLYIYYSLLLAFKMHLLIDCYFCVPQEPRYIHSLKEITGSSLRTSKYIFPAEDHGKSERY